MKIDIVFHELRFYKMKLVFTRQGKDQIEEIVKEAARGVGKLLRIEGKRIKFDIYPNNPLLLLKGKVLSENRIELNIPPYSDGRLDNKVKAVVRHEMYQDIQKSLNVGTACLVGNIFSEGLAMAFEMEQTADHAHPYAVYNPIMLQNWLPALRIEKWSADYDYQKWFEQGGLGYQLGKYFIDLIFKRYPYLNSVLLVRAPVEELIDFLYNSGINLR